MLRVAFLENQVTLELPHLGPALMLADLRARGDVEVEAGRADAADLGAALDFVARGRFDLLALDCRFPVSFLRSVRERSPGTRIVVGGLGFYYPLTRGGADFAVMGPGRRSLRRLVDALVAGQDVEEVPNLFFRRARAGGEGPDGLIDHTGVEAEWDLRAELEPFIPDFDMPLRGFERAARESAWLATAPPALVGEFGCAHKGYRIGAEFPPPDFTPREAAFSPRGEERLAAYMRRRWAGGCSFCVYQRAPVLPPGETAALLVAQASWLQERYGFESFAVQSESPFRFLLPLLEGLAAAGLRVKEIFLRGRASHFQRHRQDLERALEMAGDHGFGLAIWQIGYESFCQPALDLYNKGTRVEDNLETARMLIDLAARHPRSFRDLPGTHGMILFHPWTTLAELRENLSVLGSLLPGRLVDTPALVSEFELFDPFLPLAQKIRAAGLLVAGREGADGFRMADPAMEVVRRLLRRLLGLMHQWLPDALRAEPERLAGTVIACFEEIFRSLGKRYFAPAAPAPDRSTLDIDREVEELAAIHEPVLRDALHRRAAEILAVKEIRYFGERSLAGSQRLASQAARTTSPAEIEAEAAELIQAFGRLEGSWDLKFFPVQDKAVVIDQVKGIQTPMDRVMLAFIQIALAHLDVQAIFRGVLDNPTAPPALFLDRARQALEFLEECRPPSGVA